MPISVKTAIEHLSFEPGDVALLNDPFAGGSHLPDITMITPVFVEERISIRTPKIRDVAQPGSVLAWGARGRWFESSHPDHRS